MARFVPTGCFQVTSLFPSKRHNHRHCIAQALNDAEAICAAKGARLTSLRRKVLELVWASHRPVGAYDLLRDLSQEKSNAAPPTVYRALEFLQEHGLVHRISSLNAFVGCPSPEVSHSGEFLICRACGAAGEVLDDQIGQTIARSAADQGFIVEQKPIEVIGLCPHCRRHESNDGHVG